MRWTLGLRVRRAASLILLPSLLLAASGQAVDAASSQTPTTFAQLVSTMKLVVVADTTGSLDTGVTYTIDAWLKGTSARVLSFPPDRSPVEPGWTRVVVAFGNPTNDDARAPTIVWHVGRDGTIDPEGYQQYPGLPRTLPAMLVYFGLSPALSLAPSPSASPSAEPASPVAPTSSPAPLLSPQPTASPATAGAAPLSSSGSPPPTLALLVTLVVVGLSVAIVLARRRPRDIA